MTRHLSAIVASIGLFASVLKAQVPLRAAEQIVSPRISALRATIERGDTTAEDSFWRDVEGHTPLLEFLPPRNMGDGWVTFVWRGDDSTTSVTVDAPFPPLRGARSADGPRPLAHLPGTKLWFRTERLPLDFRMTYAFLATHRGIGSAIAANAVADPLNRGPTLYGVSIAEGLLAPKQPWLHRRPGVMPGTLRVDSLFSHLLGQDRTVTVYTPAGSTHAKDLALAVILDGEQYGAELGTPETLDNLIAKEMIKPVIVLFVNTRGTFNRTDDYSCNSKFADFVVTELVPWARLKYHVSSKPRDLMIGGSSLGGLQAACTAYWHPEIIGNVLSLSGSFFYFRGWPAFEEGLTTQTGWLTQDIAAHAKRPIRFFVSTGTFEGDGVLENRRLRDVLMARGYALTYTESNGGHDQVIWRGVIADGLIALLAP